PAFAGPKAGADGKLQARMPFTATLPVLLPTKVTAKGVPAHPPLQGTQKAQRGAPPAGHQAAPAGTVAARLHRGATEDGAKTGSSGGSTTARR
ncbi:hypothetical protein, partial [Methylobacterium indicum]